MFLVWCPSSAWQSCQAVSFQSRVHRLYLCVFVLQDLIAGVSEAAALPLSRHVQSPERPHASQREGLVFTPRATTDRDSSASLRGLHAPLLCGQLAQQRRDWEARLASLTEANVSACSLPNGAMHQHSCGIERSSFYRFGGGAPSSVSGRVGRRAVRTSVAVLSGARLFIQGAGHGIHRRRGGCFGVRLPLLA
jgi:hypothetical protein